MIRKLSRWMLTAGLIGVTVSTAGLGTAGPAIAAPAGISAVAGTATAPAHSRADARTHAVVPRNSWQHDVLARNSQQNWYRIELTSPGYVYALLGNLPANYNLRLYDAAGPALTKSDHGSLGPESVGRTLGPGTYYLRVASTSGSSASKRYALRVQVVPAGVTIGVLTARVDSTRLVVGDVVNVSKETLAVSYLDVSFYGSHGKLLRRYNGTSNRLWIPIAPGHRVPYKTSMASVPESVLKKTTRIVVEPRWSLMPTKSAAKLSVSQIKRTYQHHTGWTDVKVTGRIKNGSSWAVPQATAVVEIHDKLGVLIGFEQSSHRVPARASRKFSTSYDSQSSNPAVSVKVFETVSTVPDPE